MRWFSSIRNRNILVIILAVAAVLRFWNLGGPDMVTDEVYYALRGIGYLDYIGSSRQSTPLFWFNPLPDWTKLSMHDHPPLVFAVAYAFFSLFGVSTLVARLPFALAGIGSVFLVYLIGRKMFDERAGLIAAGVMAISSQAVYASRTALMEPLAMLLIFLTWYLFLLALENPKYWYWWGAALGFSWLAKYTALPVLVACVAYLVIFRREQFKNPRLYLGILIALVIFSPVIVYNLMLYQTRGHFDLQFAALLKQNVPAWQTLTQKISASYADNFVGIFTGLVDAYSPVVLTLAVIGMAYSLGSFRPWPVRRSLGQGGSRNPGTPAAVPPLPCVPLTSPRRTASPSRERHTGKGFSQFLSHKGRGILVSVRGGNRFLPIIFFIMYTLLLILIQPLPRFLSYYLLVFPFLIGVVVAAVWERYQGMQRRIIGTVALVLLIYELGFSVNTNLLPTSVGPANLAWSLTRPYTADFGINQLDQYLTRKLEGKTSAGVPESGTPALDAIIQKNAEAYGRGKQTEKILLVYNTHLHETVTLWNFDRRYLYEGWPAIYVDELARLVSQDQGKALQGYSIYYVTGTEYSLWRNVGGVSLAAVQLEHRLAGQGRKPGVISNQFGLPVFKIYQFRL